MAYTINSQIHLHSSEAESFVHKRNNPNQNLRHDYNPFYIS
jgi:hypothetical protein